MFFWHTSLLNAIFYYEISSGLTNVLFLRAYCNTLTNGPLPDKNMEPSKSLLVLCTKSRPNKVLPDPGTPLLRQALYCHIFASSAILISINCLRDSSAMSFSYIWQIFFLINSFGSFYQ